MAKQLFDVEITDTFGGEANYCWVRRYQVKAISERGAINAVSRREGYSFRNAGYCGRYDAKGACVVAFIDYADN